MILKGFKEKSIKKHLNALLKNTTLNNKEGVVESIGVILHVDEVADFDMFKALTESLNVRPNRLKVIAYTQDKKQEVFSWNVCFNPKAIGWRGKILNTELQSFLDEEFDVLVSYYTADVLELKLLTAKSKAHFKASIFQGDSRLNDLIISSKIKDFNAFKIELKKYLKVFNKLKHE